MYDGHRQDFWNGFEILQSGVPLTKEVNTSLIQYVKNVRVGRGVPFSPLAPYPSPLTKLQFIPFHLPMFERSVLLILPDANNLIILAAPANGDEIGAKDCIYLSFQDCSIWFKKYRPYSPPRLWVIMTTFRLLLRVYVSSTNFFNLVKKTVSVSGKMTPEIWKSQNATWKDNTVVGH